MTAWLLSGLGLVILLLAGDALVRGAVNLALRLGIPALIVSLTIVAFGTSAPELLVSIEAITKGAAGLSLGNVVGSNIANILMVLGVPALLATMHTSGCESRKSYIQMMLASAVFITLGWFGAYTWKSGLILLALLAFMLIDAGRDAMAHRREGICDDDEEEPEGADPSMPLWQVLTWLALGLVGLPIGANLLVDNATVIAQRHGISDAVIGLTLVAIGTSLPELATTVAAALRRQADVALGNVIGSNMFNLLGIIGVASFVGPIPVSPEFLEVDFWVMLAASALLIPFVFFKRDLTRPWGLLLSVLYVGYIWSLF